MACGEIGLSVDDFYSCTPRQFYNIQKGYFGKIERIENSDWLRTKVISYFIYAGIPEKKNSKKKSFSEFEQAFFNTKEKYRSVLDELSKEEKREEAMKLWNRVDNNNRGVEQG